MPNTALAQLDPHRDPGDLADPSSAMDLIGKLVSYILQLALIGAAATAFIFLLVGAIQWGTAASGEGAAKARKTMLYAAVGLIMVSLVYVFIILYNSILPPADV